MVKSALSASHAAPSHREDPMRHMFAAALLLALPLFSACAPAAPNSGTNPGNSATTPAANTITIKDFKYVPDNLTVKAGSVVTFVNQDTMAHTATAATVFNVSIAPGASATVTTSTTPGTVDYLCTLHPAMKGSIKLN
ncbi:MAG: cupredoxin domain-containing protein [Candidatus Sericytochromatia bacterium]|nr:cupredoxin domain-containing protein [Candidatus Sericytochromatia bacterium]